MSIETEDFELTEETTIIRGFWLDLGSKVVKDSGWIRIEWLIANRLEPVCRKENNGETLYRSPADGRLWHYYLVAPGLKNGGPPALELIDQKRAEELFGQFPN